LTTYSAKIISICWTYPYQKYTTDYEAWFCRYSRGRKNDYFEL